MSLRLIKLVIILILFFWKMKLVIKNNNYF